MQACDSTCSWCAREFFLWWKNQARKDALQVGRSGRGSRAQAIATSIKPDRRSAA